MRCWLISVTSLCAIHKELFFIKPPTVCECNEPVAGEQQRQMGMGQMQQQPGMQGQAPMGQQQSNMPPAGTPQKFATPPPPPPGGTPTPPVPQQKPAMSPQTSQPSQMTPGGMAGTIARHSKIAPQTKPQGLDPIAMLNERENRWAGLLLKTEFK